MSDYDKTICPNCKAEFLDVFDAAEHWDECGVCCGTCVHADKPMIAEPCAECRNYTKWEGIGK